MNCTRCGKQVRVRPPTEGSAEPTISAPESGCRCPKKPYAEVTFIVQANIAASEDVDNEKLEEFRRRALLLAEECGLWVASGWIKVDGGKDLE